MSLNESANQGFIQLVRAICRSDYDDIVFDIIEFLHESDYNTAHFCHVVFLSSHRTQRIDFINAQNTRRSLRVVEHVSDVRLSLSQKRADDAGKLHDDKRQICHMRNIPCKFCLSCSRLPCQKQRRSIVDSQFLQPQCCNSCIEKFIDNRLFLRPNEKSALREIRDILCGDNLLQIIGQFNEFRAFIIEFL